MPTRQQLLLIAKARQRQSGGGAPAASPWGNLDPAQVPPRNPPTSFREGLAGTVGEMLRGVPIAGPALLGAGERLAAAKRSLIDDKPYAEALEDVQTRQENFRRDKPVTAGSAQAGGASLAMTGAGMAFPRMMGVSGGNLLTRTLAGGGSSGAVFGADAAVRGDDPEAGAIAGAASGMLGPLFSQFITPRGSATADIKKAGQTLYQKMDQAGITLNPQARDNLVGEMWDALERGNIDRTVHKNTWAAMRSFFELPPNATLSEIDTKRQLLGDIIASPDAGERRLARIASRKLDEAIDSLQPQNLSGGSNPQAASEILGQARTTWRTMRKAEVIDDVLHRAELQEGRIGRARALQNQFRNLAGKKHRMWIFSPEETAAIERVAKGTFTSNRIQDVARLSPKRIGGLVLGPQAGAGAGYLAGGPVGAAIGAAAVPTVGLAGSGLSNAVVGRQAALADALIRGGGQMPEMSPQRQGIAALIQALLSGGGGTAARLSGGGGY